MSHNFTSLSILVFVSMPTYIAISTCISADYLLSFLFKRFFYSKLLFYVCLSIVFSSCTIFYFIWHGAHLSQLNFLVPVFLTLASLMQHLPTLQFLLLHMADHSSSSAHTFIRTAWLMPACPLSASSMKHLSAFKFVFLLSSSKEAAQRPKAKREK